jgi:hypothetical protein
MAGEDQRGAKKGSRHVTRRRATVPIYSQVTRAHLPGLNSTEDKLRYAPAAALLGFLFSAVSSALAQPSPGGTAPASTAGGLADWWWIIIVVALAAAAIWYFMKGRRGV